MTDAENSDAFDVVGLVKDLLQKLFDPRGFDMGVNCGKATRGAARLKSWRCCSVGFRKTIPLEIREVVLGDASAYGIAALRRQLPGPRGRACDALELGEVFWVKQ